MYFNLYILISPNVNVTWCNHTDRADGRRKSEIGQPRTKQQQNIKNKWYLNRGILTKCRQIMCRHGFRSWGRAMVGGYEFLGRAWPSCRTVWIDLGFDALLFLASLLRSGFRSFFCALFPFLSTSNFLQGRPPTAVHWHVRQKHDVMLAPLWKGIVHRSCSTRRAVFILNLSLSVDINFSESSLSWSRRSNGMSRFSAPAAVMAWMGAFSNMWSKCIFRTGTGSFEKSTQTWTFTLAGEATRGKI